MELIGRSHPSHFVLDMAEDRSQLHDRVCDCGPRPSTVERLPTFPLGPHPLMTRGTTSTESHPLGQLRYVLACGHPYTNQEVISARLQRHSFDLRLTHGLQPPKSPTNHSPFNPTRPSASATSRLARLCKVPGQTHSSYAEYGAVGTRSEPYIMPVMGGWFWGL